MFQISKVSKIAADSLLIFGLRTSLRKVARESCDYLEKIEPGNPRKLLSIKFNPNTPDAMKLSRELSRVYKILKATGTYEKALETIEKTSIRDIIRFIATEAQRRADDGNPKALENLVYISKNPQLSRWLATMIEDIRKYIIEELRKMDRDEHSNTGGNSVPIMW